MCTMRSYKPYKQTKPGKPTKPVNRLGSLPVYGFSEFRTSIYNNNKRRGIFAQKSPGYSKFGLIAFSHC